jgi:hypothetical protein
MRTYVSWLLVGVALAAVPAVQAQDSPTAISMAFYYRCVQGDVGRADAIYKEHLAPLLKAEQAAGRITAYGWAKHWSGGDWRRLSYVVGTDMDKMLDSRAAIIKMTESPEHAKAIEELERICSSHDDYVWRSNAGSQAPSAIGRDRSPFAMSTYFVCNAEESEADFIVKTVFAPVLDQRVKDGMIASWMWLEHLMGGKYRRLLVFDGADAKALMKNWASLQGDLEKAAPDLARRFAGVCDSHTDYIWENTK